jgi:hypothetical protein
MDVNKHNINTLSEYIDILSKYPSNKFFYRGESSYYDDRISSALRGYLKDHDFDDKELLNEFYQVKGDVLSLLLNIMEFLHPYSM